MLEVTLDRTHQENYNVRTFWFLPNRPLRYSAGQFIEMFLPHDNPDERGVKHWFTLSSAPTDKLISITTKYAGSKSSTFKKTLFSLKPGSKIKIVEPMGDFVLPKDKSIPLIFIAGGMGLTPYHSIIKWLIEVKERREVQVLLAFNQPKDILFEDLFKSYGAEVQVIVSTPTPSWQGLVGKLSADKIIELTGDFGDKRIYVSGPEPMVEALETDILAQGVNKSNLVLDFFPNYTADLK